MQTTTLLRKVSHYFPSAPLVRLLPTRHKRQIGVVLMKTTGTKEAGSADEFTWGFVDWKSVSAPWRLVLRGSWGSAWPPAATLTSGCGSGGSSTTTPLQSTPSDYGVPGPQHPAQEEDANKLRQMFYICDVICNGGCLLTSTVFAKGNQCLVNKKTERTWNKSHKI